jgi:hypothetical protein
MFTAETQRIQRERESIALGLDGFLFYRYCTAAHSERSLPTLGRTTNSLTPL